MTSWITRLEKIKVENAKQLQFKERTIDYLKQVEKSGNDERYWKYYKHIVNAFTDKEFKLKVLKVVYKQVDFQYPKDIADTFADAAKSKEMHKDVKQMYLIASNFIKALIKEPDKIDKYSYYFIEKTKGTVKNTKNSNYSTIDALSVSKILDYTADVIELYQSIYDAERAE